MASVKLLKGGGGGAIRNRKNPGRSIDIYSGFNKNSQGGGVQFVILKNPGIDLFSGFRKTSQGGGGGNTKS